MSCRANDITDPQKMFLDITKSVPADAWTLEDVLEMTFLFTPETLPIIPHNTFTC